MRGQAMPHVNEGLFSKSESITILLQYPLNIINKKLFFCQNIKTFHVEHSALIVLSTINPQTVFHMSRQVLP